MDLPVEHLPTFTAILEEGSFEGAARRLHITPSAVSQRVKLMEQRIGSVLLRRTRPIEATPAGTVLLRVARQLELLTEDAAMELGVRYGGSATAGKDDSGDGDSTGSAGNTETIPAAPRRRTVLPIVANADSLATWLLPALARASEETGALFDIVRADDSFSAERLRDGAAVAAISATREPVPGCTSEKLGVVIYRAVASPAYLAQHFPRGVHADALRSALMLQFDRQDQFQHRFIRKLTRAHVEPPRHYVPSSHEFAAAIELGMGWGMLPELQCRTALNEGRLVEVQPGTELPIPLYWQRWDLPSALIDHVTRIVVETAKHSLSQRSTTRA